MTRETKPMAIEGGKWHKHPAVRKADQLTVGERAADAMRNAMGSWVFVCCFFGVMILWAILKPVFYFGGSRGEHGFDPYPYILLNLFLSMLAAYKRRRFSSRRSVRTPSAASWRCTTTTS